MSIRSWLYKLRKSLGRYDQQTNLTSLLSALGIPDVAAKPLYTVLVTDRLDNASYGLSALKTLIDNLSSELTTSRYQISKDTFSYLDAGGVQDIAEVTTSTKILVKGIVVDCNTLTQNGTLGFMVKVDGTNYREVKSAAFTVASDDSISLTIDQIFDEDFKFTWLEGGDEAAARDLPYIISYEVVE